MGRQVDAVLDVVDDLVDVLRVGRLQVRLADGVVGHLGILAEGDGILVQGRDVGPLFHHRVLAGLHALAAIDAHARVDAHVLAELNLLAGREVRGPAATGRPDGGDRLDHGVDAVVAQDLGEEGIDPVAIGGGAAHGHPDGIGRARRRRREARALVPLAELDVGVREHVAVAGLGHVLPGEVDGGVLDVLFAAAVGELVGCGQDGRIRGRLELVLFGVEVAGVDRDGRHAHKRRHAGGYPDQGVAALVAQQTGGALPDRHAWLLATAVRLSGNPPKAS